MFASTLRLCLVICVLFACGAHCNAAIPRYSADPNDFVSSGLGHFWLGGQPIRVMGFNLRSLTHYGHYDIVGGAHASDRLTNLAFMKSVGARVARVFVAYDEISGVEVGNRLATALNEAADNDIYLIVCLTDVYGVTHLYPKGDLAYHNHPGGDVYNEAWYEGAYLNNYVPVVQYLVNRFKNDPAIFAWQLGNELKCPWEPADMLPFSEDMAHRIRALDPNHMISHGTASLPFAQLSLEQGLQLYENFDFVGVHSYNGTPSPNDVSVAALLQKPLLISEAGMDSGLYDSTERPAATDADIQRWVDLGARGYMNWGLMALNRDNGDGDRMFGIDKVWHAGDFEAYRQIWTYWAGQFANTPLPAPAAPEGVQATDGTRLGSVEVTWDKALAASEYAVLRSETVPPGTVMNVMPYAYEIEACGSLDASTTGAYCCDGDTSTYWACAHNGADTAGDHSIVFDLGSTCRIIRYVLKHASWAGFPTSANIQGYYIESGLTMQGPWTTEYMINNAAGLPTNTLTYPTPENHRYLRLRIHKATVNAGWTVRLPEFEVWGEPSAGITTQVSAWQTTRSFVDTAAPGATYLYSVKARNTTGVGPSSEADAGYASTVPATTISDLKQQADAGTVYLPDVVVSGVYGDRFYVQQPNGAGGICVLSLEPSVGEGDHVDVLGVPMTSESGERQIAAMHVVVR